MNWPAKYNSNAACEWEITAPLGHVVLAEVVDFWIGGSAADECSKSNVLIRGKAIKNSTFLTLIRFGRRATGKDLRQIR